MSQRLKALLILLVFVALIVIGAVLSSRKPSEPIKSKGVHSEAFKKKRKGAYNPEALKRALKGIPQ